MKERDRSKSLLEQQMEELQRQEQEMSKQKEKSEMKLKQRKLLIAAKMKNVQIAQQSGFNFLKEDANCRDQNGNSPLYYAAQNGDEVFCKFLVELGADVN